MALPHFRRLGSFIICFLMIMTLLGTGIVFPDNEIHVDAASGATSSGSGGNSSTPEATGEYTYEEYALPSGISGPELLEVMNSTPLFYKSGDTYIQLMETTVSNYAYYFYLKGNSYSSYSAMGYGYDEIAIKDTEVMSNLYKGIGENSAGGGSETVYGEVAEDGVYTSPVRVYKYKKGKLDKTYTGTVYVTVTDGKIAGLWISSEKSKVSKLITSEIYNAYIGKPASVEVLRGVDAISSSSISSGGGTGAADAVSSASVDKSREKYYTSNLQQAIVAAIENAPKVPVKEEEDPSETEPDIITGQADVEDSEQSHLELLVSVSDGVVTDLNADTENCVGNWESIISKTKNQYVGKTVKEILAVDAVSSATKYTTAVDEALRTALKKTLVKLTGYTTSLNGNIAMNFYLEMDEQVAQDTNAYMQFDLPGTNHTEEKVLIGEARKTTRDKTTCYVFSAGVAAKEMTSDIKAKLIWSDGESDEWSYTVRDYCDYIIGHPESYDEESVELAASMLNYGGYAQVYFKYHTDALANAGLNKDLPKVDLGETCTAVETGECTGLTYTGSSAMLTSATGLRHYFTVTGDLNDYTFRVDDKTLTPQTEGSSSFVLIDDIHAKDLSKKYALEVTYKDGSRYTLKYSVYTNVKDVVEGDYDADSKNLMKALYGYGTATKEYFRTR